MVDDFQRRLSQYYGTSQDYPADPLVGGDMRMLGYTYSTPENTNVLDVPSTGWNVQGMYVPSYSQNMADESRYGPVFENVLLAPGDLNAAGNQGTVTHEMTHRIQDMRPMALDEESEREIANILATVGRPSELRNARVLSQAQGSVIRELIPHGISTGFINTPTSLLERFGIDREKLRERVDGVPRWQLVRDQLAAAVDRAYQRNLTEADFERASRTLEPEETRGRGRPAYR